MVLAVDIIGIVLIRGEVVLILDLLNMSCFIVDLVEVVEIVELLLVFSFYQIC